MEENMRLISTVVATLLLLFPGMLFAAPADPSDAALLSGEEILLWPSDAPGSEGLSLDEKITERSRDLNRHDRIFTSVLHPSLRVHRPAAPNGAAVIVAPGGAYQRVVIDKEGRDISDWLNGLGVTAFVLKYRLPGEGHATPADVPLQDAQRAIRVLRSRAEELGIDPERIGMIGFSAGGHLAGSLAAYHDLKVYAPLDEADLESARPDFVILAYAAVGRENVEPGALAKLPIRRQVGSKYPLISGVSEQWPPTFLFHAADDGSVPVEDSARLFNALRASDVQAEIHVFQSGGHGFGIRDAVGPVAHWPMLCGEWMRDLGVLHAP
jgi:acetyl esterase/lipase